LFPDEKGKTVQNQIYTAASWSQKKQKHAPHQQLTKNKKKNGACMGRTSNLKFKGGLIQEAETDIIILTCCPGCKANAKSSPHPLSKAANVESDAANRGRVKGERGRKDEMKRSEGNAKETYL